MSWLKKLGALFSGSGSAGDGHSLYYYVRCRRCQEVIKGRVDLRNDLSTDFGEGEGSAGYFYRKVLIGRGRCFEPIEVTMTFDARRNVTSRDITGGTFVSEEEYLQEVEGESTQP